METLKDIVAVLGIVALLALVGTIEYNTNQTQHKQFCAKAADLHRSYSDCR